MVLEGVTRSAMRLLDAGEAAYRGDNPGAAQYARIAVGHVDLQYARASNLLDASELIGAVVAAIAALIQVAGDHAAGDARNLLLGLLDGGDG